MKSKSKLTKSPALIAALAYFSDHADALKASLELKRKQTAVGSKLEELSAAEKPDFARISELHFERQHLADKLVKAATAISNAEKNYLRPGDTLYQEANRLSALAGDAAVECARARLEQDFSGDVLSHVIRYHPVAIAEDTRRAPARSPRDLGTFQQFAAHIPELVEQIEMAERRIEHYNACAESRSLPDQELLNKLTPEAARPVELKPRRELTEEEQAARDESMLTEEGRRLRYLHNKAKNIAKQHGPQSRQLQDFVRRNAELANYFPQFTARNVAA